MRQIRCFLSGDCDGAIDFASAIIGTTMSPYPAVIYSEEGILGCLMEINGWELSDAMDWYLYNIAGNCAEGGPIISEDVLY